MIVCGDFAYPFENSILNISDFPKEFLSTKKIINFESTLDSLNQKRLASGIAISSKGKCFSIMKDMNVSGVTLSNNHICDFDYDASSLLRKFKSNSIATTGFGTDLDEARSPIIIDDYVFVNFGWHVIGCKPATEISSGCNPMYYDNVIDTVSNLVNEHPNKKVCVIFHWNYEFELYPQPAHRKLAKNLIDIGAEIIIGHHSHIIQGAELYKGKAIIYGLGNFYLPRFEYSGYYLDFPEKAYTGLAVDISNFNSYIISSNDNKLTVSQKIPLFDNVEVSSSSGFSGMTDEEYLSFFKEKRHKRKLLPIYNNWNVEEKINDRLVIGRQFIIDSLVRANLKKHKK